MLLKSLKYAFWVKNNHQKDLVIQYRINYFNIETQKLLIRTDSRKISEKLIFKANINFRKNNIVICCKYKVNLTQRNTGFYLIKSAVLILLQKSMKNNCNSIISVFIKM